MRWLVSFCCELATFYIPILLWKILSATFLSELLMYKFIWKTLIMLTHVTFNFFKKEIIQNNILTPNSTAQDKCILHYILLKKALSAKGLQVTDSWSECISNDHSTSLSPSLSPAPMVLALTHYLAQMHQHFIYFLHEIL